MGLAKRNIAIVLVLIVMFLVFYFYKEYQRKPRDITEVQPATKINFSAIVDLYENDEAKANTQYLGKIIQVSGPITDIINQGDTIINVFIGDTNSLHKVSCLIDKRHFNDIKEYTREQQITIKGICTGFLLDVELNRCVIVDDVKE
jgi:hypothetical protein